MPLLLHIHRTLLIASFAIWFGGFGFYAAIVVPVGTDVLGSANAQGMITRRVTESMNVFCAIAAGMMLIELFVSWKRSRISDRAVLSMLAIAVLALLIALFVLHPMMDQMIDPQSGNISDRKRFYSLHRAYLWISTFQWAAGWIWLSILIKSWYSNDGTGNQSSRSSD
jgi:predicted membrane protein